MKKLLFSIFLSFAFWGALIADDEPNVQVNSAKPAVENFRKFRIGLDYGFSNPYSGSMNIVEMYGKSILVYGEYNLNKRIFLFSELIYCGYKPDQMLVFNEMKDFNSTAETKIKYKANDPCRVYSYVLGYGFRSNPDFTKSAWRFGIGAIYNFNIRDEFTVLNTTDTITLPKQRSYSIGINGMIGLELPMYYDVLGFFLTMNISSGIIGSKNGFKMQYSSLTLFGLYYRF